MSCMILNDQEIIALARFAVANAIAPDGSHCYQSTPAAPTKFVQMRMQMISDTLAVENIRAFNDRYNEQVSVDDLPTVLRAHACIVQPSDNDAAQTLKHLEYNSDESNNYNISDAKVLIDAIKNCLFKKAYNNDSIPRHENFGPDAKDDGTTGAVSILSMIS